jgi:hypothetical protein
MHESVEKNRTTMGAASKRWSIAPVISCLPPMDWHAVRTLRLDAPVGVIEIAPEGELAERLPPLQAISVAGTV